MNYCEFVAALPNDTDNPNKHYHDKQYGFPISDDNELFGRLVLEIN
ncbi:MAG: DNA-3-methyladenine glycosylase I, partial [Neisseria sp.]|nr:DNA-3-methyladenine glycosylase I [Neisseria sp.]